MRMNREYKCSHTILKLKVRIQNFISFTNHLVFVFVFEN